VLAEAGLIQRERRGRVTWCKLDPAGMRSASVWMQGFGQFGGHRDGHALGRGHRNSCVSSNSKCTGCNR